MNDNNLAFPQLAQWICDYCKSHNEPFIKDSGKMVAYCFELDQLLPEKYGWLFSDVESFKKKIENIKKTPKEINKAFWLDQARNIEAYSTMTFWRGIELLKPAIRCLNIHEVITPAVLVRSLLELSCVFLTNANYFDDIFSQLEFPDNKIVIVPEFEEKIVKMIWGTRVGDPCDYLKQTNVLTYIQKLSKSPKAKGLLETYEYLCDVAHPNFIGNMRFWSHVEEVLSDGSQRRVISKFANKECTHEIIDKILWAMGWSSAVLRNGHEITKNAIHQLLTKLKEGK
ncbi:MAG TPA: hypothetical protein PKB02_16945 [Anaerohalosphaeraceae bacterium]|nr:hypothetical protein [Anaerohalosphaeraceae bacterium]